MNELITRVFEDQPLASPGLLINKPEHQTRDAQKSARFFLVFKSFDNFEFHIVMVFGS